ncbi:MAG: hypothetical protein QME96_13430, partial [Myxococcota bacterium]|nr:hypothetical protein [Myxococcota bacterium]
AMRAAGASEALGRGDVPPEAFQVALFLADGARNVFLQDADPIAAPPEKSAAVLRHMRSRFPTVSRVTTYARAATLAKRSQDQIRSVWEAGLTRVHVGLESGSEEVLKAVEKGSWMRAWNCASTSCRVSGAAPRRPRTRPDPPT